LISIVLNDEETVASLLPPRALRWRRRAANGPGMCNLYSLTKGQAAIRDLFSVKHDRTGNLPLFPSIFPDQVAPIGRRARACHGALGHAWAAAVRRPAGDQHPQRPEPALAGMVGPGCRRENSRAMLIKT
jgi:hypothetical protein